MALDSDANREILMRGFPALRNDPNFKIKSEETPNYNCIAWAMGYNDRRMDPTSEGALFDWPKGLPKLCALALHISILVKAFEAEGFEITKNYHFEPDKEKVYLYKEIGKPLWTHASRLVAEGVEYSKFGKSFDAVHSSGTLTNIYGEVYACMKRINIPHFQESGEKMEVDKKKEKELLEALTKRGLI